MGSSDMDDSFGKVRIVFQSDLIAPGSSTVYDIFAIDGMKFTREFILEDDSLNDIGVFIFEKIDEFSLI